MRVSWIVAIAALAAGSAASAQNWQLYGSFGAGNMFYDPASVRLQSPGVYRVWERMVFNRPTNGQSFTLGLVEVNCRAETTRSVQTTSYDSNGAVLATDTSYVAPTVAAPGTIARTLLRAICGGN